MARRSAVRRAESLRCPELVAGGPRRRARLGVVNRLEVKVRGCGWEDGQVAGGRGHGSVLWRGEGRASG